MRISIDIESAFSNPTGIGRVAREFLKQLPSQDAENEYWLLHSGQYTSDDLDLLKDHPPNWNILKLPASRRNLRLAALAGLLPPGVKSVLPKELDVALFPTGYALPIPAKRTVGIIHDLNVIDIPEASSRTERIITRLGYRDLVKRSESLVTVSEYSRTRIIDHWNLPADRVTAIPLGVSVAPPESELEQSSNPYFVWAGAMAPRKNVPMLVQAFAQAADQIPNVRLILIGSDGSDSAKVRNFVAEHNLADRVEFTGFLTESELATRMSGALAFVFPSIYEGFGLPIIESMSLEVPVITANRTSTAEVGGDSALLIDPTNQNELADAMVKVATDSQLRAEMVKKGIPIAKQHTWERFAKSLLEVLTENNSSAAS
jgi:glycosyltransferase involved in cell wall biosynthesis